MCLTEHVCSVRLVTQKADTTSCHRATSCVKYSFAGSVVTLNTLRVDGVDVNVSIVTVTTLITVIMVSV